MLLGVHELICTVPTDHSWSNLNEVKCEIKQLDSVALETAHLWEQYKCKSTTQVSSRLSKRGLRLKAPTHHDVGAVRDIGEVEVGTLVAHVVVQVSRLSPLVRAVEPPLQTGTKTPCPNKFKQEVPLCALLLVLAMVLVKGYYGTGALIKPTKG